MENQVQAEPVAQVPVAPPNLPQLNANETEQLLKPAGRNRFGLGLVAGVSVVLVLGIGIVVGVWATKSLKPDAHEQEITPTVVVQPTVHPTDIVPMASADEIEWLSQPEAIASLDIFKASDQQGGDLFIVDGAKFYKVANLSNEGELISGYFQINAPGGSMAPLRIVKASSGKLEVVTHLLDEWTLESFLKQKLESVGESDLNLNELNPPDSFTVEGMKLNKGYGQGSLLSEYEEVVKLFGSPYGEIYRYEMNILDSDQIKARTFILRLPDNTVVPYTPEVELLATDSKAYVSWTDGRDDQMSYTQALVSGCGGGIGLFGSVPVIKSDSPVLNSRQNVGRGPHGGEDIIQVFGAENELVRALYANYKIGRDYEGGPEIVSLEEFADRPNHFLWQDSLGDWQVFASQDYAPMAECGKPVIYLYPEEKTEVLVKVGAKVRLSDPDYPQDGWRVTAYPNGELAYQGKTYSSLFWEGRGEGYYPDLRNFGQVVKQGEVVGVLNSQLRLLGLNDQEANEFMDFWQPRLPNTPYIRLTWLGTKEMNELAPLTVEPIPDTLIRVFLEFEGLNEFKTLTPQKLPTTKREGFTLVEWGGLLKH